MAVDAPQDYISVFFPSEVFLLAIKIALFLPVFSFSLRERSLRRVPLNRHLNPTSTLGICPIKFHPVICSLTYKDLRWSSVLLSTGALSRCLSRSSVCRQNHGCCWAVGESQLRSPSWGNAIVGTECLEQGRPGWSSAAGAALGAQEGMQFTETGGVSRRKISDESEFHLFQQIFLGLGPTMIL